MKKFARRSDVDGKGINSGYIFGNGLYYCQSTKQAKAYIESLGLVWEEELKKFNTNDEWFYYAEWEEIDNEEFFDIHGNTYKVCLKSKKPIKISTNKNEF